LKRRQLLFGIVKAATLSSFAGRLASAASAQEDLDPVKLMPDTHKLVFENSFVRVIEGRVPAGGRELKHRHPHCVLVSLADFDSEVRTLPDGEWKRFHRAFGTVSWNEAVVHEVRILGTVPSHTIRIELKV
jgi:hypothetical protein